MTRLLPLATLTLAALLCAPAIHAAAPAADLVAPADAPYVLRDGSIAIVGNDGMATVIEQWNAMFRRAHPAIRFTVRMEGSSAGMPALTAGATAFAPMTRDMWPGDKAAFRQVHGYDATPVRVGYNGHGPRPTGKNPPAIYAHARNPLKGLTMAQLGQIFTDGAPDGDVNTWSQLGLDGAWAPRRIHAYGLRDDGGFATGVRTARFGGRSFSMKYEALPSREAAILAVANDPYGIALLGWVDAARISDQVRIVPLAAHAGAPFYGPSYAEVSQGRYPLSAAVQLYVNLAPGARLDPLVKAYLQLVLSPEGQAVLAAQRDAEEGYVPLSAADLAQERRQLDAL